VCLKGVINLRALLVFTKYIERIFAFFSDGPLSQHHSYNKTN